MLPSAEAASPVVSLSSSGFDDTVLGRPELWVVDFYAPVSPCSERAAPVAACLNFPVAAVFSQWCAHCQTLAPHFDAAAGRLNGIAAFGKVDCTVHTDIAERYSIHAYPTVLAFQPGSKKQDEPDVLEIGDGTAEDLVHAALSELSMIVLQRTREERLSDAASTKGADTAGQESCTKHIDPESGLEVDVCAGSGGDSHEAIEPQAAPKLPNLVDVAIVGGGPAGLGAAIALKDAGVGNYVVLERGQIGETFRRWPDEMKFITPSFYSNPFKVPDLNAVNPHSSPAFVLNREHPTGLEYAEYLDIVTEYYQLPVHEGEDVVGIVPSSTEMPSSLDASTNATFSGFKLETASGVSIFARYVLWAGGEFQYPKRPSKLQGAEFGVHSSTVGSWWNHTHTVTADRQSMLVIGGYESGIDAAVNLAEQGVQNVFVFDKGAPWANREGDPSEILSPRTIERLEMTIAAAAKPNAAVGRIHLVQHHAASIVDTAAAAGHDDDEPEAPPAARFELTAEDGRVFLSNSPPILATGFKVHILRPRTPLSHTQPFRP
jgi:putative flavoprotein involved in K+ transport